MGLFLALPTRGAVKNGTVSALDYAHHGYEDFDQYLLKDGSILTLVFNHLVCEALNSRPQTSLFGMLHDDITPVEPKWLKKLVTRYKDSGADILSCVVPIRDKRGLTSTAVWNPETGEMRRLTMTETEKLPETFDADMAGYPGWFILPNTGCWVCDFTKPWVEEMCFHNSDRIICVEPSEWKEGKLIKPGVWKAQALSEDWGFGIWAAKRGLKVLATKMNLFHVGEFPFPSMVAWGEWKTDEEKGIAFTQQHSQDGMLVPLGHGLVPLGRRMDNSALRQQYLNQMQSLDEQIKEFQSSMLKCQGAQELCRGFLSNLDAQDVKEREVAPMEKVNEALGAVAPDVAEFAKRNGVPVMNGEAVQD